MIATTSDNRCFTPMPEFSEAKLYTSATPFTEIQKYNPSFQIAQSSWVLVFGGFKVL